MPASETEKETKYKVKQLVDKKIIKGKVHYKVWWQNYKKAESTWEPANQLIEDGLQNMIDEYNKNH